MASKSKIKSIVFKNSWNPPQGTTKYIHDIIFENGEAGKAYLEAQSPAELVEGVECSYNLVNNQIKNLEVVKPMSSNPTTNNTTNANNANLAGYAVRYATDIVVAEIGAKVKIADPVKRIKDLSEALFSHTIELGTRPF